ncbi:Hypothetical predicted protein [Mytilus galloprovincialis]|nr:Hypothetical predicted protein [Mytilus galloprovincialis]
MSDRHYDMLFNMLIDERRARQQQDRLIEQLQQDLLATKQEVTQKYIVWNKNNGTLENLYLELENKTKNMERNCNSMLVSFKAVANKYTELQNNYTMLKNLVVKVETTNHVLENKTNLIEKENKMLTQLQTISDLKSVYNLWNQTKHLEEELLKTNYNLESIVNDVDARKQDFLALFSRLKSTDKKLDNVSESFHDELTATVNASNHMFVVLSNKTNLMKRLISEKVALSSCGGQYGLMNPTIDGMFKFPDIRTSVGVSSSSIFVNSGVFICKYAGLYHISVTIMTDVSVAYFEVRKNNKILVPGCIPNHNDHSEYYSSGTINTAVEIDINDTISVWKGNVNHYYGYYSCFTIVKL